MHVLAFEYTKIYANDEYISLEILRVEIIMGNGLPTGTRHLTRTNIGKRPNFKTI
jgi:hypothetical protein